MFGVSQKGLCYFSHNCCDWKLSTSRYNRTRPVAPLCGTTKNSAASCSFKVPLSKSLQYHVVKPCSNILASNDNVIIATVLAYSKCCVCHGTKPIAVSGIVIERLLSPLSFCSLAILFIAVMFNIHARGL